MKWNYKLGFFLIFSFSQFVQARSMCLQFYTPMIITPSMKALFDTPQARQRRADYVAARQVEERAKQLKADAIANAKPRIPINESTPLSQSIRLLGESDPKLEQILFQGATKSIMDGDIREAFFLHDLADMNLRGPQILVAFEVFAKGDMRTFKEAVANHNPQMIQLVNSSMAEDYGYIATLSLTKPNWYKNMYGYRE